MTKNLRHLRDMFRLVKQHLRSHAHAHAHVMRMSKDVRLCCLPSKVCIHSGAYKFNQNP